MAEATEFSHLEEHEEEAHEEEGHGDAGHEEGDGHDHTGGDPHIWLDPTRYAKVAEGVRDELSKADPDHAADYRTNTEKLVELNDDVDSDMAALDGINLSGMERGEF